MPRRGKVQRHKPAPDAKYGSLLVQVMINKVMRDGKKSLAERIVYDAMDIIADRTKEEPRGVFEQAMRNAMPILEVRPRRVGGATYQIPLEVRPARQTSLAMRWILGAARGRSGRPMSEKLATELIDAYREQGSAIKKREDTHRMAEANKAFVHYRW
jgi:small subunit ribosomal protein S7